MSVIASSEGALSPAIQDYVKACYRLEKSSAAPIAMVDLSKSLGVSPPSVTNMMKRLESAKLVKRAKDGRVSLTELGESLALEVIRHHRLLEKFLVDELGMNWAEAHEEAETLEHHISERFEALLDKRLDRPSYDPHGEPIPRMDGTLPPQHLRSLLEITAGARIIIQEIRSHDADMLAYLQKKHLVPGTRLKLEAIEPFNGPLLLATPKERHSLGRNAAACIYVASEPKKKSTTKGVDT